HKGSLIQYGWNAGARHRRIFGLVKNLARKTSPAEQSEKDRAILGILALTWNLLSTSLPKEVIDATKDAIAASGLPPMASQDDIHDQGYHLSLPGGPLTFSTADRAPAEAYMSQNYSACVFPMMLH
ncbi:hypothetical protein BU15DRAFT_41788, partial [Melanogaster broomeanus]